LNALNPRKPGRLPYTFFYIKLIKELYKNQQDVLSLGYNTVEWLVAAQ